MSRTGQSDSWQLSMMLFAPLGPYLQAAAAIKQIKSQKTPPRRGNYLKEKARHVNLLVLMHSISHSPTERTLSESRTICSAKRLASMARKKHSETHTQRRSKSSAPNGDAKRANQLTRVGILAAAGAGSRIGANVSVVRHRVNVIIAIWLDIGVVIELADRPIAKQAIITYYRGVAIAVRDAVELVLREAHFFALGERRDVVHVANDALVQSESFAALHRTICAQREIA